MNQLPDLETLERLYTERAGAHYGEGVSQIEHALQCAALAEADGAAPGLVAAALLHDVGHLFEEEAAVQDIDTRHEIVGARALGILFGEDVRMPIALHVAAKRYLCATDPGYLAALSPASVHSLKLQGGPFDAHEAAAFEGGTYYREALALRRYDDIGKRDQASERQFADYMPLLRELADAHRSAP